MFHSVVNKKHVLNKRVIRWIGMIVSLPLVSHPKGWDKAAFGQTISYEEFISLLKNVFLHLFWSGEGFRLKSGDAFLHVLFLLSVFCTHVWVNPPRTILHTAGALQCENITLILCLVLIMLVSTVVIGLSALELPAAWKSEATESVTAFKSLLKSFVLMLAWCFISMSYVFYYQCFYLILLHLIFVLF